MADRDNHNTDGDATRRLAQQSLILFSPPTPAPSPSPPPPPPIQRYYMSARRPPQSRGEDPASNPTAAAQTWASLAPTHTPHLSSGSLSVLLSTLLPHLNPVQVARLLPNRRRDFLADLPPEVALLILSFVNDVRTLSRASRVSRTWKTLVEDEVPWKVLCARRGFEMERGQEMVGGSMVERRKERKRKMAQPTSDVAPGALASVISLLNVKMEGLPGMPERRYRQPVLSIHPTPSPPTPPPQPHSFSYRTHFKASHITEHNWRHSGRLTRSHRSQDNGTVTSLAMDNEWIAIGLANSRVHVFSVATGVLARTLSGHEAGVWSLWLVSRGGASGKGTAEEGTEEVSVDSTPSSSPGSDELPFQSVFDALNPEDSSSSRPNSSTPVAEEQDPTEEQSDPCNASRGWGQTNALVVSGSCDKMIRVWDIKSGYCLYTLRGHRSTVRCIKMFHGRPVAVSGGRDHTLRVWDIQKGTLLRTLEGHTDAVRCLDVYGNQVVSGSYDCSVRLWDVDTGECLKVFNGHYHQVYTVAFDGERIASGGLDTTVRIWSAGTGACLALLQGHSALVCQLQLSSRTNTVITGSADGRIIVFKIAPPSLPAPLSSSTPSRLPTSLPRTSTDPTPARTHIATPIALPLPRVTPPSSPAIQPLNISGYQIMTRVQAHGSSVAGLQFDDRRGIGGVGKKWVVSGGNDGRVVLWEWDPEGEATRGESPSSTFSGLGVGFDNPPILGGGMGLSMHGLGTSSRMNMNEGPSLRMVRDLTEPCEGLWKVAFRGDVAVICALRAGRTVLEIWNFRPVEENI